MKLKNIAVAAVLISAAITATKDASAQGPPVVITNPASLVASFSATLNSSVDPHGLPTTVHFEYGTTTGYGQTTANQTKTGNTFQNVAANISGLTPNTTYHFRIWAMNSAGTVHGVDRTFRTLSPNGPPVVITNPASLVASFSATLNSSVDPHGLPTTVHFEYGTTTGYGQTTANQTKTGNTFQNVAANISGLTPNTTYHFRIWAMNSAGTVHGVDRTFRTLSPTGPPVVITNPASLVASFSATLNGSVDPHGLPTTVHFEYGTTTGYGQTTANQTKTGNTFQNVAANISGLTPNTTYHFRIWAMNSAGTVHGVDRTFRTLSPNGPPVVITNPASLVASFSATLNSSVDPHGLPTTVHFEYGTTTGYGQTTANQTKTGNTFQNVAANISGLTPNTTYHFRIWAMNSAGTVHGVDRTFRTLSPTGPPVVITNPATNIATSSATLNGTVNPHGSPTTLHFQWGTTNTYGHNTPDQSRTGNTFQNVSANISGLTTHTTYHFRIIATNSGGTSNGLDQTFTTLASAPPTPTPTPFGTTPTPTPTPFGTTPTPTPTPFGSTPTPTPRCDWIKRAPVPYAARGIFAASDDTYVYCGGGYDGTTAHADLLRYDPAANSWTPLASSPDQHFLSQAVFFNNKIYNIGGFGPSGGVTNTTRIYDVAANSWTTGAPMPVALSNMATALWNGIIYVAGGYDGVGAVNTLYAYDIATNAWSTRTSMPQALFLSGFGAINGKLYIAAGNNGTIELNTLYIYNIATNTWSTGADVPTAVTGPGSSVFCGGLLWLYGGGFPTTLNITQIYSPEFDTWYSGNTPNMNVNRLWFYGTAIDNTSIVAPGGDTVPGTPVNENEQLVCECEIDAEANSRRDSDSATNVYRNSNSDADSWLSRRQLP